VPKKPELLSHAAVVAGRLAPKPQLDRLEHALDATLSTS
jgi:hypothetical protein